MGKLLNMLLVVLAINLALVLFLNITPPGSALYQLIINPQEWGSLSLINYLQDAIALVGVIGIVIGTFFTKSDFLVFAGISSIFFSFGFGLVEFYQRLVALPFFNENTYLAVIIVSPLLLTYLYVILKFWRGTD